MSDELPQVGADEPIEIFIDNWYGWLKVRMPSIFEMWTKIALTELYKRGVNDTKKANQKTIDELRLKIKELHENIAKLKEDKSKAYRDGYKDSNDDITEAAVQGLL